MRAIAAKLVRLVAAGTAFGVVGVLATYAAWRCSYPYALLFSAQREVAALEQRVAALRAQQKRLEQQLRLLSTPEGIKLEARRLGLLKPGERSLRFLPRPEPRSEAAPPAPGAAAPQPVPAPSSAAPGAPVRDPEPGD